MKTALMAIVGLIGMIPGARATVIISQSQTLPSPPADLIISQGTPATGSYAWNGLPSPNRRDLGQSFKAPADMALKDLTLNFYAFGNKAPGASFTLKIYETDNRADNPATGQVVFSDAGTLPSDLAVGYVTFDLGSAVDLTAGKYYTFIFSFNQMIANEAVNFGVSQSTPSFDGLRWESADGTTFTNTGGISGSKLVFYAYGEPIPEGNSTALLGLGVLVALGCLSRKQSR